MKPTHHIFTSQLIYIFIIPWPFILNCPEDAFSLSKQTHSIIQWDEVFWLHTVAVIMACKLLKKSTTTKTTLKATAVWALQRVHKVLLNSYIQKVGSILDLVPGRQNKNSGILQLFLAWAVARLLVLTMLLAQPITNSSSRRPEAES